MFAECFLTIPFGIFLGKISRVLVENAGITWQEIKNMLLNDYGEDFMMKVSKKKIYKIIKRLNSLATFMYFVYWVRMIIDDRKTNGDSISIRKSIKKNLFEPYVEDNVIDIQGEVRK